MRTVDLWQNFEWRRASDGYKWLELENGRRLLVPQQDQKTPLRTIPYRPMAKENLGMFSEFADLRPEPDAILAFADRYGSLGWPVLAHSFGDQLTRVGHRQSFDAGPIGESVDPRRHYPGLVGEFLSVPDKPEWEIRSTWMAQIRLLSEVKRNHALLKTVPQIGASLQAVINIELQETVGPFVSWSARDHVFHFRMAPRSLVGAMWLQAALVVSSPLEIRHCPVCETVIEVSRSGGARSDAKFCSARCKSRDQRNRIREAKRLRQKKKLSTAEIAERIDTKVKTVRGWLRQK